MVYLYVKVLFSVKLCEILLYLIDLLGDPDGLIDRHAVLNLLGEWYEEFI